ncbi:hypothetical protein BDN71DRAFT_1433221 [Pleurotus eryngii]|uniref:Uncharacterized protein n=1 Tax=Pleurotus eryngii TaxID=5323 RepID=A0A9P5ZRM4_PLEER|nr:hypothetical protein BDN71DRAFT_1433221 [Pleurotus eryngii]
MQLGYRDTHVADPVPGAFKTLSMCNLARKLYIELSKSGGPSSLSVPLSTRLSSSMTILTATSIYSLYTPLTNAGVILSGINYDKPPEVPEGFQIMVNSLGLQQTCAYADFQTDFVHTSGHGYATSSYQLQTGEAWRACFIGKILSASHGTHHSSIGSVQDLPVPLQAAVRNILVLGWPRSELPQLDALYAEQNRWLSKMVAAESTEFSRTTVAFCPFPMSGVVDEFVHVVISPKYVEPDLVQRLVTDVSNVDGKTLCNIFPLSRLPDYDTKQFLNPSHRLAQLEIYDVGRTLVRPWQQYDVLKPRTVVLVCTTLQHNQNNHLLEWTFNMQQLDVLIPAHFLGGRLVVIKHDKLAAVGSKSIHAYFSTLCTQHSEVSSLEAYIEVDVHLGVNKK